jgi:NAD(P)-dependent dehydrogenase (short-subunit alcohol dehydrogenase family)
MFVHSISWQLGTKKERQMTTPSFDLDGKIAIVTGASVGGIGEEYAVGLAEAGASVVCADINREGAEAVAKKIGDRAIAVTVDITNQESVREMVQATIDAFGGVDILVNNAALMEQVAALPLSTVSLEEWNRLLSVNLTGALLCSQAVVPSMTERGGGAIVNQSSGGAWAMPGGYSLTKLAIVALTQALASELGAVKIRVNAIAPGMTDSAAGLRLIPEDSPVRQMFQMQAPLRPFGNPDDLVGALLLLCSSAGGWMTGQTLNVDGGWVMRT